MMRNSTIKRQLIRLADAMMRGGKKRVKCEGHLFRLIGRQVPAKDGGWDMSYTLGGSCALGAAYEGLFGTPPIVVAGDDSAQINGGDEHMESRLRRKLPVLELLLRDIDERVSVLDVSSLANEIITRNDGHHQPRWKIAKWIRGLAARL